jgi:hypothetical protein
VPPASQVAVIEALSGALQERAAACAGVLDAVTAFLMHHTRSLSVSNPSIVLACLGLFAVAAREARDPRVSGAVAAAVVPAIAGW